MAVAPIFPIRLPSVRRGAQPQRPNRIVQDRRCCGVRTNDNDQVLGGISSELIAQIDAYYDGGLTKGKARYKPPFIRQRKNIESLHIAATQLYETAQHGRSLTKTTAISKRMQLRLASCADEGSGVLGNTAAYLAPSPARYSAMANDESDNDVGYKRPP